MENTKTKCNNQNMDSWEPLRSQEKLKCFDTCFSSWPQRTQKNALNYKQHEVLKRTGVKMVVNNI